MNKFDLHFDELYLRGRTPEAKDEASVESWLVWLGNFF